MYIILVSQQGKMTRNSWTIARNFNAVVEFKWCAIRPNFITLLVYIEINYLQKTVIKGMQTNMYYYRLYREYLTSLKLGPLAAGTLCRRAYRNLFTVSQNARYANTFETFDTRGHLKKAIGKHVIAQYNKQVELLRLDFSWINLNKVDEICIL